MTGEGGVPRCPVCGPLIGEGVSPAEHVMSQSHRSMVTLGKSVEWIGRQVLNQHTQGNRIEGEDG
jgi:hypothetical protein